MNPTEFLDKGNIMEQPIVATTPSRRSLYRVGGISAILLSVSYVIITVLYTLGGALPGEAEGWLRHLAAHTPEWWAILVLSVLTNLLFLPILCAIYVSLKETDKNRMLLGVGLVGLFVVLDLAVTWPNYASLIALSGQYAAAVNGAAILAAASYAVSVLSSTLFGVYAILIPALGILFIGHVMLKGKFGKVTGYLGIVTGVFGVISVAGPILLPALGTAAVLTSVLTTAWVLFVGVKLLRLAG